MASDEVLVVGGGVAGPAAAMALRRLGRPVRLVERRPADGPDEGSVFTVATNGVAALEALDAAAVLDAVSVPTVANVLWGAGGAHLATMGLGAPLPSGRTARTARRHALAVALRAEAARRGVDVTCGVAVADVAVLADGRARVRFDDGTEGAFGVVVAADGVHSRLRRVVDPAAPDARSVGIANYGGRTGGPALDAEPERWHMIFGRNGFFGYHPMPGGGAVWFANVPEAGPPAPGAWRDHLRRVFAPERDRLHGLLDTGELDLCGAPTYDLPHVPRWSRGPLILVGDAAHAPSPTSGQGASLALEDAVVLATSLRDAPDRDAAFARYEALRRPRVERIVADAARTGALKKVGPAGAFLRDLAMRGVFRWIVTEARTAWVTDHRVGFAAPAA